jgi:hypothetical protein
MSFRVDRDASTTFRDDLAGYLSGVVDNGQFVCPSRNTCEGSTKRGWAFAGGQLSYVGDGYATFDGGVPVRVLVISMQVGDGEAPVSMARRKEQVVERVAPTAANPRNPHMRGVTFALQYLFGLDLPQERLDDGTHVLEAYAMANASLCSHYRPESRRGGPTPTMLDNCAGHLRRTIEVLKPTVIHSQGWSSNPAKSTPATSVAAVADNVEPIDEWLARIHVGEVDAVWCFLPHPAAGAPYAWQWPSNRFHQEKAAPALRRARTLARSG